MWSVWHLHSYNGRPPLNISRNFFLCLCFIYQFNHRVGTGSWSVYFQRWHAWWCLVCIVECHDKLLTFIPVLSANENIPCGGKPDPGANLLTCNKSESEKFCWLQWNRDGQCQLSANHLLNSGATGAEWKELADVPSGWRWLTDNSPVSLQGSRCESAPCVSTGSPAVWPMADPRHDSGVQLQRLKQGEGGGGRSEFSLNSCTGWLTGKELPANSPYCFCILFPSAKSQRQLSFYYSHVFAQRGCCEWRQSAP